MLTMSYKDEKSHNAMDHSECFLLASYGASITDLPQKVQSAVPSTACRPLLGGRGEGGGRAES